MDEAPRPIRREALPPRSRNGIYGPLAALATVMFLGIASLAVVVAPNARRERVRDHRTAIERATPVELLEAEVEELDRQLAETDRKLAEICRGPIYRAGQDGKAEMVFEVCSGAEQPRVIVDR